MMLLVVATVCFATKAVAQAGESPLPLKLEEAKGRLLRRVEPVYPPIAKAAGVEGDLLLEVVIGKDGSVKSTQFIDGPPLLIHAASDAVKRWKYQPYLLNGKAVEIRTTVHVFFSLGGSAPPQQNQAADVFNTPAHPISSEVTSAAPTQAAPDESTPEAQYKLAEDFHNGANGQPKDDAKAVYWLKKAADQGFAPAQYSLALLYTTGGGDLPHDDVQAVHLFRKAAEQGDVKATHLLGLMYKNGMNGLPKDDSQAINWFRKAAGQGDAGSQFNLGVMYENGRGGLPVDTKEAVAWYRKAAEQGDENARAALSLLNAPQSGMAPPQQNQAAIQAIPEPQPNSGQTPSGTPKQVVQRQQLNPGLEVAERSAVSQERLSPQHLEAVYQHASEARAKAGFLQAPTRFYIALSEALKLFPKLLKDAPSPEATQLVERIEALQLSLGKSIQPKTSDDVLAMLSVFLDCRTYDYRVANSQSSHRITGVMMEIDHRVSTIAGHGADVLDLDALVDESLAPFKQNLAGLNNALNEINITESLLNDGAYVGADDRIKALTDLSVRFPFVREYLEQTRALQADLDAYVEASRLTRNPEMSLSEELTALVREQELLSSLQSEPLTRAFLQDALASGRADLTARIEASPSVHLDKGSYKIPERYATTTSANAEAKERFLSEKVTDLDYTLASVAEIRALLAQPSMMTAIGEQCGTSTRTAVEAKGKVIEEAVQIRGKLSESLAAVQSLIQENRARAEAKEAVERQRAAAEVAAARQREGVANARQAAQREGILDDSPARGAARRQYAALLQSTLTQVLRSNPDYDPSLVGLRVYTSTPNLATPLPPEVVRQDYRLTIETNGVALPRDVTALLRNSSLNSQPRGLGFVEMAIQNTVGVQAGTIMCAVSFQQNGAHPAYCMLMGQRLTGNGSGETYYSLGWKQYHSWPVDYVVTSTP
jgi:TonB family protein